MASKKKKELEPPPQVSDDDVSDNSDSDSDSDVKRPTKSKTKAKSRSKSNSDSDRSADSDDDNSDEENGGGKHVTSSKSIITEGKVEASICKKKVTYKVWVNDQNYRPGVGITLHVTLKNESDKTVKSIQAVLQTIEIVSDGKKKKKKKPVQAGKHEEWFQGARFPLEGYTDYEGTVVYTLPSALPDSSDSVLHELVVQFDVKKTVGYNHIKLLLPIRVRK